MGGDVFKESKLHLPSKVTQHECYSGAQSKGKGTFRWEKEVCASGGWQSYKNNVKYCNVMYRVTFIHFVR